MDEKLRRVLWENRAAVNTHEETEGMSMKKNGLTTENLLLVFQETRRAIDRCNKEKALKKRAAFVKRTKKNGTEGNVVHVNFRAARRYAESLT